MRRLAFTLLLLGTSTVCAYAQNPNDYDRILLPVIAGVPGAFGSFWSARVIVLNNADAPVFVFPLGAAPPAPLEAHHAGFLPIRSSGPGEPPGHFLYVPRAYLNDIHISTHIIAYSFGEPVGDGVEVPVVRTTDFRSDAVHLVGIVATPQFRRKVRIYDAEGRDGVAVVIRVYGVFDSLGGLAGARLAEQSLVLRTPLAPATSNDPFPVVPAYAEYDFASVDLARWSVIRVEIEPDTAGARIWALATATHNATQQVTTYSPQ
jgi:hypothetical protein